MTDRDFIQRAIELSKESVAIGGYPVGAVIVKDGEIVSTGLSNGKQLCDPTSHAETDAIRKAGKKLNKRNLDDVVLYSSLEPCVMCLTSSFWAYIPRIMFACSRDRVSSDYFEGAHNIFELNEVGRRKIDLAHFDELEDEALNVITEWEEADK
ncbi:nucleoside deaminase [Candidatus Kaiserbacteria bacterium]|nr:nucleoside deaminase [Candidatus Kaiserbacteria bacterium]